MTTTKTVIPLQKIEQMIVLIRGNKVMLDRDLAQLYGVPTKVFNQAVKRNKNRFPEDFMFQLTMEEVKEVTPSRSQFVTLKRGWNVKYAPYAFTQEGVAMLSSVLNSECAVEVNITIMRAFVKLREMMITHKDLAKKIEILERKFVYHDEQFKMVFEAIRKLIKPPNPKQRRIGF